MPLDRGNLKVISLLRKSMTNILTLNKFNS